MPFLVLLGLLLIAPFSKAFLVKPTLKHATIRRGLPGATMVAVQRKGDLVVTNKGEGYDLHGVLTVKREDSKSLWVLCHGLCSSCEGTVPRFVSENLDGNTFRQVGFYVYMCRHYL